ncbi:MAG: serine--tRNA ligase, partial [Solirubrobacteraceae bacterium]|nr:serine--tRNA ligase [Solirubrobacteraceae bacterium]
MLDLRRLRSDPEAARAALARRGDDAGLDGVLRLDERRRALLPEIEGLRAEQNEASQAIGRAKQEGGDASAELAAMKDVAARAKALGEELAGV